MQLQLQDLRCLVSGGDPGPPPGPEYGVSLTTSASYIYFLGLAEADIHLEFRNMTDFVGTGLDIRECIGLERILFPLLYTYYSDDANSLNIVDNGSLSTVDFSSLVSANGIHITGSPSLHNLAFPSLDFSLYPYFDYDFSNNGLNQASVDGILARAAATMQPDSNAGSLDLSGGTNASPSLQGLVDFNAIELSGVTVFVN